MAESSSTTLFREYLRIKTVQPNPDYEGAKIFLKKVADAYGLKFFSHECVPGKPVIILTLEGTEPGLPSILLNSHIDVVPVDESKWHYDPFGAHKDENGNIYARGSQDMKCVGIQHLEAVRALMLEGFKPKRTIHISYVPDEEIGGKDGMELFVETEHFAKLNIGFALDEGLANPEEYCYAYYGERAPWWIVAETSGPTGHGSQLFQGTAVDRLMKFLNRFTEWRQKESSILFSEGSDKLLGDVTTVNINMFKSGAFSPDGNSWQTNIIPSHAKAALDIRFAPTVDLKVFEHETLVSWAKEFDVTITILQSTKVNPVTDTNPSTNPFWKIFQDTCSKLDVKFKKAIFPAATDSRFIRRKGIPAIGFSPMARTPILLHDHDEYLNETTFLNGITFFTDLVRSLSSHS